MTLSELKQEILKEFEEKYPVLYRDEYETGSVEFVENDVRKFISESLDYLANEMKDAVRLERLDDGVCVFPSKCGGGAMITTTGEKVSLTTPNYNSAVHNLNKRIDEFLV